MTETENKIGLAELIEQVKQELLNPPGDNIPLFAVDSVELELQVAVKKEGTAGIKIYVVEIGGGGSRDDIQTVRIQLSPLLDKQELREIYKRKNPEQWKTFVKESSDALIKGNENLKDQF